MLASIYIRDTGTYIVEIPDNNYESIAKAFELIGHSEFTLADELKKPLKTNVQYYFYNQDYIDDSIKELGKLDLNHVEVEGYVIVYTGKYVFLDE